MKPPRAISRGEEQVRKLAHQAFRLAQQAQAPLTECRSVLAHFDAACAQYGDGLVRLWYETEADVWRLLKTTCPYCGAQPPCTPEETHHVA